MNPSASTEETESQETDNTNQETESQETSTAAAKLTMENCIDPILENVPSNVTFTRCSGETAQGLLDLSGLIPNNLRVGVTIAGVAGNVTPAPANCGNGDSGCVVQGPTFTAVTSADLASSHIKHNVTIGGVTGNYAPPCSADGASSCLVDGTDYKAAKLNQFVDSDVKGRA